MTQRPIEKIYILSQTHTDLGYTDHLESVLLHHRDILDRALDICEATFDNPPGTQHRWSCELTSTTLDYLRTTSPRNADRFLALHKAGRISVSGLRYHWTPLVSKPLAIETLKDIDALRDEFGVTIRTAMQCDVNGLAWFWNDLLVAKGISFLSTHQNPHRGYWGRHVPSAWRWQNRSGGEMVVHQGEHYGVGNFLRLSRAGRQDRAALSAFLARHCASAEWPFPFSVLTNTNAANGDNVFPDQGLCPAIRQWNETEAVPMEIVTLDQLADIMAEADLPLRAGEWMDSWCDGEAATPLETAAARAAERLLPLIQEFASGADPTYRALIEALALYDEHTWGAHSAATAPNNIFATIQRTQKSNHAYRAFALSLRLLADGTRKACPEALGKVEGDPSFGAQSHDSQGPNDQSYLVANPYDFALELDWPVPQDRGAGPQISIPQAYGTNAFFPGFGEDGWTDAQQDTGPLGSHRLQAQLAPREVRVITPVKPDLTGCDTGPDWIATAHARLAFDASGGLSHWTDHASGETLACDGSFVPEVQLLKPEWHRRQIFQAPYWERSDTPMGWNPAALFEADQRSLDLGTPYMDAEGAHLPLAYRFASGIEIEAVWTLPLASRFPRLTAIQRCPGFETAFSVNWPLHLPGFDRTFVYTGDGLVDAREGHVPSSSLGWQSVQNGIVLKDPDGPAISVASLDAPLYQPGGPTTRDPHRAPEGKGGLFWTINTHWDTNFPVRVTDAVPFRLVLGFDQASPVELRQLTATPIIVRAPFAATGQVTGFWRG